MWLDDGILLWQLRWQWFGSFVRDLFEWRFGLRQCEVEACFGVLFW